MGNPLVPYKELQRQLTAIRDSRLNGSTVHLYQNDYTPTHDTQITDLVEADFSGYEIRDLPNWSPAWITDDGAAAVNAPPAFFQHSGGGVSNTVYGWWEEVTGSGLVSVQRLDSARTFAGEGDAYTLALQYLLADSYESSGSPLPTGMVPASLVAAQGVRVWRSTDQSIPDVTPTAVQFDVAQWDSDGFWQIIPPGTVVIPTGLSGQYLVSFGGLLAASGSATGGTWTISVNGSLRGYAGGFPPAAALNWAIPLPGILDLVEGDQITAAVYQSSGGPLNLLSVAGASPLLSLTLMGKTP